MVGWTEAGGRCGGWEGLNGLKMSHSALVLFWKYTLIKKDISISFLYRLFSDVLLTTSEKPQFKVKQIIPFLGLCHECFLGKVVFYSIKRRYGIYNRCGVGKHMLLSILGDLGENKGWTASLTALRNDCEEAREQPGYKWTFCWKYHLSSIKRLLLITKDRHLQLMILIAFCMNDAGIWGHWKFSLGVHLNSLGSAFLFFSTLSSYTPKPQGWAVAVGCSLILVKQEWPATFFVLHKEKLKII